jgi:uncharacterized protein with HEPN domain
LSKESEREWKFYVQDMIRFSEHVLDYTRGLNLPEFTENSLVFDATLRNLELIGESATHIPQDVRDANNEIPWRLIIATRNQLIHGYLGIDNDTVWSIIQDDIPILLTALKAIKA